MLTVEMIIKVTQPPPKTPQPTVQITGAGTPPKKIMNFKVLRKLPKPHVIL